MSKTLTTTIPFSGFYESAHSENIDRAIDNYFDKEGDGEGSHEPESFYFSFTHYKDIRREYAKLYAEGFSDWFELETNLPLRLAFVDLDSPREYNFATDRIFCKVPLEAVRWVRECVPDETLAARIKESFTSCSGFISSYSSDLTVWDAKPLHDWDHNEVGTLIEAALIHAGAAKRGYEDDIVEHALSNGKIDILVDPYLAVWEKQDSTEAQKSSA